MSVRLYVRLSVCLFICMSVCLSVHLKLKILVTAEPIGFHSSGNKPTGTGMVLSYFLVAVEAHPRPKKKRFPLQIYKFANMVNE